MREYHVRICEGLGVKFPGPTRQNRKFQAPSDYVRLLSQIFRRGGGSGTSAHAESARGISPRAAHRSGRDTLASSGSCHRTKAAAFR